MANIVLISSMQRTLQVYSSSCTKTTIVKLLPMLYRSTLINKGKEMCSEAKGSEKEQGTEEASLPEEPTTCCMSGCANCVWIQYAEEVTKMYEDGGEKAKEIIMSKVTDPNTKAFLMMELKNLSNNSS